MSYIPHDAKAAFHYELRGAPAKQDKTGVVSANEKRLFSTTHRRTDQHLVAIDH